MIKLYQKIKEGGKMEELKNRIEVVFSNCKTGNEVLEKKEEIEKEIKSLKEKRIIELLKLGG